MTTGDTTRGENPMELIYAAVAASVLGLALAVKFDVLLAARVGTAISVLLIVQAVREAWNEREQLPEPLTDDLDGGYEAEADAASADAPAAENFPTTTTRPEGDANHGNNG